MNKIIINSTIKFLLSNQKKIRIVLFAVVTGVLVGYGITYNPKTLVGTYLNWVVPTAILILFINIIISKVAKKKHWVAKPVKYLLYFTKYSCILYLFCFWFIVAALAAGLGSTPIWNSESFTILIPILSLLLL